LVTDSTSESCSSGISCSFAPWCLGMMSYEALGPAFPEQHLEWAHRVAFAQWTYVKEGKRLVAFEYLHRRDLAYVAG
jgi:hypothetical protein